MVLARQIGMFDRERTIAQHLRAFHAEHPYVLDELIRLTEQARDAGRTRMGIRLLWERLRWTMWIERGDGDFKLNDHLHSRYARLICERRPDLASMFELRELRRE